MELSFPFPHGLAEKISSSFTFLTVMVGFSIIDFEMLVCCQNEFQALDNSFHFEIFALLEVNFNFLCS